jgi:hypothetical protein
MRSRFHSPASPRTCDDLSQSQRCPHHPQCCRKPSHARSGRCSDDVVARLMCAGWSRLPSLLPMTARWPGLSEGQSSPSTRPSRLTSPRYRHLSTAQNDEENFIATRFLVFSWPSCRPWNVRDLLRQVRHAAPSRLCLGAYPQQLLGYTIATTTKIIIEKRQNNKAALGCAESLVLDGAA